MSHLTSPVGGTERGPARRHATAGEPGREHPDLLIRPTSVLVAPGQGEAEPERVLHASRGRVTEAGAASLVLDAPDTMAVPALSNAHDHGRPVPHLAFGALDGALETWLPDVRRMPELDAEASAVCFYGAMLRAGVTSVMHHERPAAPDKLLERLTIAGKVARRLGIRVALAVPMMDRSHVVYEDTGEHSDCVVGPLANRQPQDVPDVADQLAVVDALDEAVGGDGVTVQYGPAGPQWCSTELLEAIADASSRGGRRVHMHLLETVRQREWADHVHPEGLVQLLDDIGLLGERLSVAHGVWLRDAEMELLSARGVVVVTNASSNLRLRSGMAPVRRMQEAGVEIAMGLDGTTIDDDLDPWKELRLHHLLHAGTGLVDAWTAADACRSTMSTGHRVVTGDPRPHGLHPGAPADVVLVSQGQLQHEVHPGVDPSVALVARASRSAVRHVVAAGRVVVRDGRLLGADEPAAAEVVLAQLADAADGLGRGVRDLRRLQGEIRRYYTSDSPWS